MTTSELGGLTTRIVDDGDKPELALILCHGFGAPGHDLVPLGEEILRASETLRSRLRCYFPEAPLGLDSYGMFGSRAWWMLDIEAIQRAVMEGIPRERDRKERPEGMLEARNAMLALIEDVKAQTGLDESRIVLGGFSQGSMLTVDVATRLETSPAGLIAWSGTLLNEDEWRQHGPRHKGLKVVQSHGRQDVMLPFEWAEHLRACMTEMGWEVEWVPFNGPHTIPTEGLLAAIRLLEGAATAAQ